MNPYAIAKTIHVSCVVLSITGFAARYALARRGSNILAHPLVRILPHVNDTVLLAAAVAMLVSLHLNPLSAPWLSAKIAGLVAYILLGMVALRHARTSRARTGAFVAALLVFGYVVSVAVTKSALGPVAWLVR